MQAATHEARLPQICLPQCHIKAVVSIKFNISNNYIWISADKTTDILGRWIINIALFKLLQDNKKALAQFIKIR